MACNSEVSDSNPEKVDTQIAFEKGKWNKKIDGTYPYRHQMLDDILYQDTIRKLTRQEVLNLLGEPERVNGDYLYYLISQNKIGLWPIQTKTLVIKFADEERVEWIKLHG
jgi:hypothetical protein